jgi:hypothetical protein
MLSLDTAAFARLTRLRHVTQRSTSTILRMLVAQSDIAPGTRLRPHAPPHAHQVLFRPGLSAGRLDALCDQAACTRSALVRQLLAQCPVPTLPDIHLPPVITLVRPARPAYTKAGRIRGVHPRAVPSYLYDLLAAPDNQDLRARLEHLARTTGRSIGEVLRLLVGQAQVSTTPDIHLEDGPVIVRITRQIPPRVPADQFAPLSQPPDAPVDNGRISGRLSNSRTPETLHDHGHKIGATMKDKNDDRVR